MKNLFLIIFSFIFIASCGSDTADQAFRKRAAGSWEGNCHAGDVPYPDWKMAVESEYAAEYSTGVQTMYFYTAESDCDADSNIASVVYTMKLTTGSVTGETDQNNSPDTYYNVAGTKVNYEVVSVVFIPVDITDSFVTTLFNGHACDSFTGTPVAGQEYDIAGCTAIGALEVGDKVYNVSIISSTDRTMYNSLQSTPANDPNLRPPLDNMDLEGGGIFVRVLPSI